MPVWIALILWLAFAFRTIAPRLPAAWTAPASFTDTATSDFSPVSSAPSGLTFRRPPLP